MITVFSGSYGYAGCDFDNNVISLSLDDWEETMNRGIETAEEDSRNDCDGDHYEDDECMYCEPDVRYVGPFQESLKEVLKGMNRLERRMTIADLRVGGVYVY